MNSTIQMTIIDVIVQSNNLKLSSNDLVMLNKTTNALYLNFQVNMSMLCQNFLKCKLDVRVSFFDLLVFLK